MQRRVRPQYELVEAEIRKKCARVGSRSRFLLETDLEMLHTRSVSPRRPVNEQHASVFFVCFLDIQVAVFEKRSIWAKTSKTKAKTPFVNGSTGAHVLLVCLSRPPWTFGVLCGKHV